MKPKTRMKTLRVATSLKLRLYVAGQTPRSLTALENVRRICERFVEEPYSLEVVDLLARPEQARVDQILAIPTLVRNLPLPTKKIIGDLSDTEKVLVGLELRSPSGGLLEAF